MNCFIVLIILIVDHQILGLLLVKSNNTALESAYDSQVFTSTVPDDISYTTRGFDNFNSRFKTSLAGNTAINFTGYETQEDSTSPFPLVNENGYTGNFNTEYINSSSGDFTADVSIYNASFSDVMYANFSARNVGKLNISYSTTEADKLSEYDKLTDTVYNKYELFKHQEEGYLFIAHVDCNVKNGLGSTNETEYFNENNSSYPAISDKTTDFKASINIDHEIRKLNVLEKELHALYKMAIRTSKQFACGLQLAAGRRAFNLSKRYVQERQDLQKSLKNFILENRTVEKEFLNMEFFEKILYEKNLNFTRNLTHVLEKLCILVETDSEINEINVTVYNHMEEYNKMSDITVLVVLLAEIRNLKQLHTTFYQGAEYINYMIENYDNFKHIFSTTRILKFIDMDRSESEISSLRLEEQLYTYRLEEQKSIAKMCEKAGIIFLGVVFLIGIVCNGLLVVVFIRHDEIRTVPHLMLLNLAVSDIFSLIVNIPVFYSTDGCAGDALCKVFQFVRTVCVGVSVYTVVVISFQRYVALSLVPKKHESPDGKRKSVLVVMSVWIIGIAISVPHALIAGVKSDGSCYDTKWNEPIYQLAITLFDALLFCTIPVFLITVLTGFTVEKAKFRVKQVPVEEEGEKVVLSFNIFLGLVIVFASTYVIFYLFRFVFVWSGMKIDTLAYIFLFLGVRSLNFFNACLNPIVLYIVSRKYRSYVNEIFLCRKKDVELIDDQNNVTGSVATVESTF